MANEFFSGAQTVAYVEQETTYGTPRHVAGADAFRCITISFTPAEERNSRPDYNGTSDYLERYRGRKSATFEITKLLLPSGSVTTEPDDNWLWTNALGRLSMGTTSFSYVQSTGHTESLTIRRGLKTGGAAGVAEFQEHVMGAIVNGTEVAWGNQGNNGLATVRFSGLAKEWGFTGNTSLAASMMATTSKVTLTVKNAKMLSPGSLLKIQKDTGGNSGIRVTWAHLTNNQSGLATTRVVGATHTPLDPAVPYNPTTTTGGTILHAKLGTLSLDGSTSVIKHLGGRVTIDDKRSLLNEEVGTDSASLVYRADKRDVTFSMDFIVKKDEMGKLFGDMHRNTQNNMQVVLNGGAYATVKIRMKRVEFDLSPPAVAGNDMMRLTMTGRALGVAGNDGINFKFM